MTNLEQIEKIIKKIIPEIMELKEGCRLYNSEYGTQIINDQRGTGNSDVRVFYTKYRAFYSDSVMNNKIRQNSSNDIWWDILGRPISLEDVLMTERWIRMNTFEPQDVQIQKENWEEKMTMVFFIIDNWIQGKSLSEQTEKVIETITNLLKYE